MTRPLARLCGVGLVAGLTLAGTRQDPAPGISSSELLGHIRRLASDEFEGRRPGTRGEDLTVAYLTAQFKALGLRPGPDGSYEQQVPLVGLTPTSAAVFTSASSKHPLKSPEDFVAVSRRGTPVVRVDASDVVFVGYGVVAPEYGWDDYKGLDVTGKTLLMLVNDPPVPHPSNPRALDDTVFKGRAMTYYGRYSYKYEIASAKGAAAAIVIHETGPAGYPYSAVATTWKGEHFDIKGAPAGSRVAVEGWLPVDRAIELFAAAGADFFLAKQRAARRDFAPVRLGLRASFDVKTTIREFASRNVVARLEGSDPRAKDEYVAYTAHWDHLGRDTSIAGDQIFNGALDNASGVAGLLELARAFSTLRPAPRRSILFLALTAEESGLVGARYYTQAPPFPLASTLAVVNIDGLNPWGRTKSLVNIGHGQSTLDDVLALAAAAQGRTVLPDLEPEKGLFYRSDQIEFAKRGVPALFTGWTGEIVGKPPGYGDEKGREYSQRDYHRPTDDVKPGWDLAGAVEDLRLLFDVGRRVAAEAANPSWRATSEFKRARDR